MMAAVLISLGSRVVKRAPKTAFIHGRFSPGFLMPEALDQGRREIPFFSCRRWVVKTPLFSTYRVTAKKRPPGDGSTGQPKARR